jgi:hypothetical protein
MVIDTSFNVTDSLGLKILESTGLQANVKLSKLTGCKVKDESKHRHLRVEHPEHSTMAEQAVNQHF